MICDRSTHLAPFVADQKDLIRRKSSGVTGPLSAPSPGAETHLRTLFECRSLA